jgi:aminopeptidase C
MYPEHCDAATQKQVKKLMALSDSELKKKIAAEEAKIQKIENDFKSFTEDVQKNFQSAKKAKEDRITNVKNSGYKWLFEIKGSRKRKSMSDEL